MYEVHQEEPPKEFVIAWQCAGRHIQEMGQEGVRWLRATLNPPIAEHLSFCLGNQLFFIFVETGLLPFTGSRKELFLEVCREAKATPCVLKMERSGATFKPVNPGWGLLDAITGSPVNPTEMVSTELIEMSDWELHDFAIQIVRSYLEKQGKKVFSAQSSLHIDPSIWFEENDRPCWVVVRADRYPKKHAARPDNLEDIKRSCAEISRVGFFASVTVASADDPSDSADENVLPLYRGHGLLVRFEGLEPL
jgi:hypothetical protein